MRKYLARPAQRLLASNPVPALAPNLGGDFLEQGSADCRLTTTHRRPHSNRTHFQWVVELAIRPALSSDGAFSEDVPRIRVPERDPNKRSKRYHLLILMVFPGGVDGTRTGCLADGSYYQSVSEKSTRTPPFIPRFGMTE